MLSMLTKINRDKKAAIAFVLYALMLVSMVVLLSTAKLTDILVSIIWAQAVIAFLAGAAAINYAFGPGSKNSEINL
jgi:hypothetical protein